MSHIKQFMFAAIAAILFTSVTASHSTAASKYFDHPVYSGFVDNDMEVLVYVRVYAHVLANGTIQYIYQFSVYPIGTNCPGAAGCAGLELWTGMTPSQHEPTAPNAQQVANGALDPNDNDIPIWNDPADRARKPIEINYQ